MASAATLRRREYLQELKIKGFLICGICGFGIENPKILTVDHIIPKARGGSNHVGNLQPAHYICNQRKANMYQEEHHDPHFNETRRIFWEDKIPAKYAAKRSYEHRMQMKERKDERRRNTAPS